MHKKHNTVNTLTFDMIGSMHFGILLHVSRIQLMHYTTETHTEMTLIFNGTYNT